MMITLGWWLVPFAITILAVIHWVLVWREDRGFMFAGIASSIQFFVNAFVITFAWLIYVLCTR